MIIGSSDMFMHMPGNKIIILQVVYVCIYSICACNDASNFVHNALWSFGLMYMIAIIFTTAIYNTLYQ